MSTKYLAAFLIAGALMVPTGTALAASLTDGQIQAIITLLTSFGADQSAISNVNAALRGQTAPVSYPTKRHDRSYAYDSTRYYTYAQTYPTQPFFPTQNPPSTVSYAPSMTFTATPTFLTKGQSTTLTWNSLNSNRCGLVESTGVETILMTSGSITRSPSVTTTYRLWCMYDRNSAADVPSTQSVTIYVQ